VTSDFPTRTAARALGVPAEAIVSVEPVKHGLTNDSWLVRTQTDAVIVRASNAAEEELRIDRASEAAILRAVAAAGIGPEVLLCEPADRILVTRYAGTTWTQEDALRLPNIERLAGLLARLHELEVPAGARQVELISAIEGYLATLDRYQVQTGLTSQPVRSRATEIAQELSRSSSARLCHNDVHHLNVVEAGELRLVDWEYAGAGEPLFDLASACVYNGYDRVQREALLSAYAPGAGADMWRRLELACWLFEYIRDLWLAVRYRAPSSE
jgi:thiamine kinase